MVQLCRTDYPKNSTNLQKTTYLAFCLQPPTWWFVALPTYSDWKQIKAATRRSEGVFTPFREQSSSGQECDCLALKRAREQHLQTVSKNPVRSVCGLKMSPSHSDTKGSTSRVVGVNNLRGLQHCARCNLANLCLLDGTTAKIMWHKFCSVE